MDKRKVLGRIGAIRGPLRGSMFDGVEGTSFGDPPHTKLVYICHPLSGDIAAVKLICDAIVKQELPKHPEALTLRKVIPLAPHLVFPTFMDDEAVEERALALRWCLELVGRVDEVWVFGDVVSTGMRLEIERASKLGIPVLFKDEKTFGKVRRSNENCET